MEQKQTAVEWLVDQIKNEDHHTEGELGNSCIDVNTLLMLCEQAKQMEKEQIVESHHDGYNDGYLKNNASSAKYYYENYK